jgi:hypothetical protein
MPPASADLALAPGLRHLAIAQAIAPAAEQ